jgi:hypothetical protein
MRAVAFAWLALACSTGSPSVAPAGGSVIGPADTHCSTSVAVKTASCSGTGDAGAPISYGAPMYGTSGADDDCKYDVTWSSTPIRLAEDATFTVTLNARATGAPVPGAQARIEAFLSDVHPAPATLPTVTETSSGVYRIAPIRFDRSGRWTVRFHFFDACLDALPDSPHGHAAFFVDVP